MLYDQHWLISHDVILRDIELNDRYAENQETKYHKLN
jgi:hypothetical protein